MLTEQSVQCIMEHCVDVISEKIIIYKPNIGGDNVTLPLHKHCPIYFVTHYDRVRV
jgi:hypothetical protein